MRDWRGRRHFLLVTLCSKSVSMADFAEIANTDRLSFASPERRIKDLGVDPGAVTLLGLVNDANHALELYIDVDDRRVVSARQAIDRSKMSSLSDRHGREMRTTAV